MFVRPCAPTSSWSALPSPKATPAGAQAALERAVPFIDKAASKGIIHKATASRKISRLSKLVSSLA